MEGRWMNNRKLSVKSSGVSRISSATSLDEQISLNAIDLGKFPDGGNSTSSLQSSVSVDEVSQIFS